MTVTYASQSGVQAIFNQYGLTAGLDDNRDKTADTGLWTAILANADAETESYVIVRYPTLKLSGTATVPHVIKVAANKLAASDILARQGKRNSLREETTAWLVDLAAGNVILPDQTDAGLPESTTREVARIFGDRQLTEMGEPGASEFSEGDENDPLES